MFFSKNVGWHVKQQLSEALGIQCTEDLWKYLGVPILHKRANRETYQFILEKVNKRLSSWKARNLSFAGRITLTKLVLQAIPTYAMQTVNLPKSICEEVDKACRSFIWGDSEQGRRIHLVAWDKICRPKQYGRLGLRKTGDANLAYMMRASWRLCNSKDMMWSSIVRSKYKCGSEEVPKVNKLQVGSNFWRGIHHAWDLFSNNLVWRIGNGSQAKFWLDTWIPHVGPLHDCAASNVPADDILRTIIEYVSDQGRWNHARFAHLIPASINSTISAMVLPHINNIEDSIAWKNANDGVFSLASAYEVIQDNENHPWKKLFLAIWRWSGLERIRYFLWKASHAVLLTNDRRYKQGMSSIDTCPICNGYVETHLHAFRDCGLVRSSWEIILGTDFHDFSQSVIGRSGFSVIS